MSIIANVIGGLVQLTGNPVWIKCTGASIPAGASNYKIILKITSEDGKLEGAPFLDGIAPDENGEAWFDISGYVDQPVNAVFQYPLSGTMKEYPTQAFNIQVQPGESYIDANDEPVEIWGTTSGVFQMLKGGSSPRQLAMWEDADTNFYEVYLENGKFLTHRPWGDIVHPTQPVKLYFMTITDVEATFNVRLEYDDYTEILTTIPVTLNKDYLYEFNCNPASLGVNLEPTGTKASHFDVWLESAGVKISDNRRFHYDWIYCERPFFLLFANSIGGIDDVYFSGFIKENFDVNGDVSYSPRQRGDTVFNPTLKMPSKLGQNNWEINSGPKMTTQLLHLRDLLVARQIWFLYPNLSVTDRSVIPVNITSFSKTLFDRIENIHSISILFEEAHHSPYSFDNRLY
jgi:hypothetical protein